MRCTLWHRVPVTLAVEARRMAVSGCIDSAVQCQLPGHSHGSHYALLDEAGPDTALWLRWNGTEVELRVLADCTSIAPRHDGDACCLFSGHADRHTWEDVRPQEEARFTQGDHPCHGPSVTPQPDA